MSRERDLIEVDPASLGLNVVPPPPFRMATPFGGFGGSRNIWESATSVAIYTPEAEDLPSLSINDVVETITYLDEINHTGIPLGAVTLGKDLRARLIQKLKVGDIDSKLASAASHDPKHPMEQFLGGRLNLITNGMLSGQEAKEQAGKLLHALAQIFKEMTAGRSIEEVEITNILSEPQLDNARDRVESAWVNSEVINQLNPLTVTTTGMICEVSRLKSQSDDKTLLLPQVLVGVLRSLKHEESAEVLKKWILNEVSSSRKEECLLFLKAAVQISGLIDTDDLIEICGGTFNLLPFKSLHEGINEAVSTLETLADGQDEARDLQEVAQQLYIKYRQIALSEKGLQVSPGEISHAELYEEIAISLVLEANKLGLSKEEAASHIVKVLEQIGTKDFARFQSNLSWADAQIGQLVEIEAARRGLVENENLQRAAIKETFTNLQEHPFKDVSEINFRTATKFDSKEMLIKPETKTIKFTIVTGTFGPFTEGHRSMVKRLLAYIKYQQKSDPPEVQRFILISPLTMPGGVQDYGKKVEEIGTVYERVASMLLGLSDLTNEEKDLIMMTTSLTPNPRRAARIDNSIRTLMDELRGKIRTDFRGISAIDASHEVAMGSDEIYETGSIPVKARLNVNDVVLVVRHGHLIRAIEDEERLRRETGVNTVILTPDSGNIASKTWRSAILARNYYGIPAGARDFLAYHWSKRSRDARRSRKIKDEFPTKYNRKVPPISWFYRTLLKEYPTIANLNGATK